MRFSGERLKELRTQKGLTILGLQCELARRGVDVAPSSIYRLEAGDTSEPGAVMMIGLCDVLAADIEDFMIEDAAKP